MFSVYIVEDDKQIREELTKLLEQNTYQVYAPSTFEALVENIVSTNPSIVLLDLGLPLVDGHVICRELREQSEVPIIVVTSRNSDLDELMSINLGADDFITKPYSSHILLARMATILKRVYKEGATSTLSYKGIDLDTQRNLVSFEGSSVELTKNEMRILGMLLQNPERIVARAAIQQELWQSDAFIDDNTLTVNVNRLRSTLATIGLADIIHTKRGQGYYLL